MLLRSQSGVSLPRAWSVGHANSQATQGWQGHNGPSARRQRNPGTRCKPCTQLSTNDVFWDSLPKKSTCTRTALVSFGVQTKTSYASNRMQLGGLYSLYTSKARLWKSLKFYLYYSTQFLWNLQILPRSESLRASSFLLLLGWCRCGFRCGFRCLFGLRLRHGSPWCTIGSGLPEISSSLSHGTPKPFPFKQPIQ